MPAGALSYQSNGDIIFYRAREVTASVSPHARVCALVGARTIRFSGMAGSVVHLLEQPRPGCDRVLPHSPEPGRRAGREDRNLRPHERVHRELVNGRGVRAGLGPRGPTAKWGGACDISSI